MGTMVVLYLLTSSSFAAFHTEDIAALIMSGESLLIQGEFEKSIEIYTAASELSGEAGDSKSQVKCQLALGLLHWNIGKLDISTSHYDSAYEIAVEHGLDKDALEASKAKAIHDYYQKGKEFADTSEYSESLQAFKTAINLAQELESKHHELKCQRRMSINYWEMSEYQEFHRLNELALQLAHDLNHEIEVGRTLNNIGLFFVTKGEFSQSLSYYAEALSLFRKNKKFSELTNSLNNLANIYMSLGSYTKSLELLMQALKIDESNSNLVYVAMDLNNLGEVYRRMGATEKDPVKFELATEYFMKSLKIAHEIGDINSEIIAYGNLGNIYLENEDYLTSIEYSKQGLKIVESGVHYEQKGMIHNNLGFAYLYLDDDRNSIANFNKSVEIGNRIGNYNMLWEAIFGLGLYHEKCNEYLDAAQYYLESIAIIDKLRSRITIDIDKAGFVKDKLQVYYRLVELYFEQYKSDTSVRYIKEIYKTIEKAKARAFLDLLSESDVFIKEKLTPELKQKERAISEHIAAKLRELASANQTIEMQEIIRKQLASLEEEYSSFLNKVRVEVPELSEIVSPEPYDLDQVQRDLLDSKTVLLEYFLGDERSYLIAISEKNFRLHELSPKNDIQDSIKAYIKLLSDGPSGLFKGEKASRRLYNELIEPIEDLFNKSVRNLIIIPDGILYYLPFESLIKPRISVKSKGEMLIENYNISYMPSASSLLFLQTNGQGRSFNKDLLAMGNPEYKMSSIGDEHGTTPAQVRFEMYNSLGFDFSPLPHSEDEIQDISKYFEKSKCDIYLKDQANEHTFKSVAQKAYRIIHFACHGFVDEAMPLRSALVLSLMNNEIEDGFLQAREIYNMRLGSEMVVLSACQTGRGRIESGEGILGLQRVFFFAGARSVVSTLWEIGDKPAAQFMEYFYDRLAQGYGKANSLRLAKIQMMKSRYAHPFFWAGFILSGEYESPIF